jgi:hypothetical protein
MKYLPLNDRYQIAIKIISFYIKNKFNKIKRYYFNIFINKKKHWISNNVKRSLSFRLLNIEVKQI